MSVLPFLEEPADASEDFVQPERPASDQLVVFPDVLPVPIKFGSVDQRAMHMKQITCVGARHWMQTDVWGDADDDTESHNHCHLKIWIFSSDQGGDQQGANTLVMNDVFDALNVLMFRQFCMLHQVALVVKRTLSSLDPYWSRLAKLINVWRSASNAKRLFLDLDSSNRWYHIMCCPGFVVQMLNVLVMFHVPLILKDTSQHNL